MTTGRRSQKVDSDKRGRRKFFSRLLDSARDSRMSQLLPLPLYSIAFAVYYFMTGNLFEFLLGLYFALAFPVLLLFGKLRDAAKYWIPFVTILLSYEALQGVVGSLAASQRLLSLYNIDAAIWGFNLTGWLQSTFSSPILTEACVLLYFLHFPLVVATSTLVWIFRKPLFGSYRTTITLTSYAALVTFLIVPTTPPWYQGVAHDLVQDANLSVLPHYAILVVSLIESDRFAAFPSLHAAYAVIFSYFMLKVDIRLALIAIPITLGILFSTIYLGQHYLIDLIGGGLYALVPCFAFDRLKVFRR